jgi:hypothetical protein
MLAAVLSLTKPPEGFEAPGIDIFDYTETCLIGDGRYCVNESVLDADDGGRSSGRYSSSRSGTRSWSRKASRTPSSPSWSSSATASSWR